MNWETTFEVEQIRIYKKILRLQKMVQSAAIPQDVRNANEYQAESEDAPPPTYGTNFQEVSISVVSSMHNSPLCDVFIEESWRGIGTGLKR